ncbi:MAG: YbaB/EbfC family nucleoid-associated protein [Desulfobulbaceae bacterium]|nr:YbaB/EbfC family nucleoid-associated protein [Desulfobulbaceae bacterium]
MNMEDIMKQAQQFQQRMGQVQEELAAQTITSSVGGGMVTATVNGKHELLSLTIEKEVVNPDDVVMLQDLVVAAVNDAMNKAREMAQAEMGKLTGGLNIPGLSGLS